ncbi:AtuA-related protein [Halomonas sp. AOP35-4E-18]|uniref:AtuA-related protein n=1 Tax=Halomonas sp. AOP35-4E-18 TaxID=3457686 RepID=UPI00403378A5
MSELLHRYAHARAGDKGDRLSLGVFVYQDAHYSWLVEQLSESNVAALFEHRGVSHVTRYLLPHLNGMNLVLDDALQGGVNGALNLDGHGKTLSALLLSMKVTPPPI